MKRELDRVLTLLRNKIRERGYTQLEVQKELGWGRSYISQLLTKQKALRVEQVLLILRVIGVEPGVFFAELFPSEDRAAQACTDGLQDSAPWGIVAEPPVFYGRASSRPEHQPLVELRSLVRGLVGLLADKELIDLDDLTSAVGDSTDDPPFARDEVE